MKYSIYVILLIFSITACEDNKYTILEFSQTSINQKICQDLIITKKEILSLIKNGHRITQKTLDAEFKKTPCDIKGKIKYNNKVMTFQYNFGNYIILEDKIIGCYDNDKGCSTKMQKKRIKVEEVLKINHDSSSYKPNCGMYNKIHPSAIKKFFLHASKENYQNIIKSNSTSWSGCEQTGKLIINNEKYIFKLNFGGFASLLSEDNKTKYFSCYHFACPELE